MDTLEFGVLRIRTALILCGISTVLAITNVIGWTHFSYWLVLAPAIYTWARPSLYRLISDAVYHAHHRFDLDMFDAQNEAKQAEVRSAITLDTESFLRAVREDDERAGRA